MTAASTAARRREGGYDVRVGVVSWNTAPLLDRCLTALPDALGGLRAEIVVVDNASSDDSVKVAQGHGFVEVRRNSTNVGYARAMNLALGHTSAPALVALNPDTDPPPGSLARLVADLDRDPNLGLVVPRLRYADGRLQHSVHRFPSPLLALVLGLVPHRLRRGPLGRILWLEGVALHDRHQELPGAWAIGAVHCIRSAALAGQDPYDERWFMYTEDMDLCWRLQQRGWRLQLDPSVEIVHVGNAGAAQMWQPLERELNIVAATYTWYQATRGPAAARRLAAAHVIGTAVKLAVSQAGKLRGRHRAPSGQARADALGPLLAAHARQLLPAVPRAWRPGSRYQ
ncbi:MAG: glycosyltransferase [Acidimicrobiales bacterium]